MLDAVTDYLPSPLDIEAIVGTALDGETEVLRHADEDEPFSALAFKIQTDQHLGKLTYIRVYSGKLDAGSPVLNSTKDRKERVGKIYQMHANKREERAGVGAGEIVAVNGMKQTTTGDTLCDPQKPVILESMTFPAPVISVAIEPKTKSDQEKLGTAIQKLAEEDPTFQVRLDEETGQTVISGMGELHLEILVDRMRREFNVEANVGKPQVAYRETIRKAVERYDYTHKKQTGGSGQFAKVQIAIEPLEMSADGATYEFENKVTGGRIPREYIPSVDQGMQDAMQYGVLAGYPMVGVKASLLDGAVPRGRLLGDGLQDRRLDRLQGGRPQGQPGPARAADGRRGRHPGREHGRRHRRPELPARNHPGDGRALRRSRRQGAGPALGDVRLRGRPAQPHPGTGELHHGVRLVRRGPVERGQGDHRQGRRASNARPPPEHGPHPPDTRTTAKHTERGTQWPRPSSSGPSRTSTSAPSGTSTMGRRR